MQPVILGLAIVIGGAHANVGAAAHESPSAGVAPAHMLRQASMTMPRSPALTPVRPERSFAREQQRPATFRPQHVKSPKLRAGVAGAAMGLLAGAVLGYVVTTRSDCDDCGLSGLVLGAPIGSVVGAVVAVRLK